MYVGVKYSFSKSSFLPCLFLDLSRLLVPAGEMQVGKRWLRDSGKVLSPVVITLLCPATYGKNVQFFPGIIIVKSVLPSVSFHCSKKFISAPPPICRIIALYQHSRFTAVKEHQKVSQYRNENLSFGRVNLS